MQRVVEGEPKSSNASGEGPRGPSGGSLFYCCGLSGEVAARAPQSRERHWLIFGTAVVYTHDRRSSATQRQYKPARQAVGAMTRTHWKRLEPNRVSVRRDLGAIAGPLEPESDPASPHIRAPRHQVRQGPSPGAASSEARARPSVSMMKPVDFATHQEALLIASSCSSGQ